MVFKKCVDGESKIDWVKSIATVTILGSLTMLSLKLSIDSNTTSKENSLEIKNLKEKVDKIDAKLDRLIERK